MKRTILFLFLLWQTVLCSAQSYTLIDLERNFLEHNFSLLAQHFNVSKAEALRMQAAVWNNPNLNISEFNLWKTYDIEKQPLLFGKYGKNQQIAIEIEQLIETSGKRKKRIAMHDLLIEEEKLSYEELLGELKWKLRNNYYEFIASHQQGVLIGEQVAQFQQLLVHYERQQQNQNVSKAEVLRIKTELLNLRKQQIENNDEARELLKELQLLTQIENLSADQLQVPALDAQLSQRIPSDYLQLGLYQNMDIRKHTQQQKIWDQELMMEKAAKVPDIEVGINYDRGGNIMKDFIGLGIRMDLPIWNKNKGNIKAAQYQIQEGKVIAQKNEFTIKQTLLKQFNRLIGYEKTLKDFSIQDQSDYKQMALNYDKHLRTQQITMIEYIDFMQSYRESQIAYWELLIAYHTSFEELQYLVGKDF